MLRCVLIEDLASTREMLADTIRDHFNTLEIVGEAESVEQGIQVIKTQSPDLVFLDITLIGGTAFDLLKTFDTITFGIIFLTGHDNFESVMKAFDFSAIDYIVKLGDKKNGPFDIDKLKRAIDKARQRHDEKSTKQRLDVLLEHFSSPNSRQVKIALPSSDGYNFVHIDHIISCEADGNYTHIFLTSKERLLISRPLKEMEDLLSDETFFRVHKSHLINLNRIQKYVRADGGYIIMDDGRSIPLASRKRESFVEQLNRL